MTQGQLFPAVRPLVPAPCWHFWGRGQCPIKGRAVETAWAHDDDGLCSTKHVTCLDCSYRLRVSRNNTLVAS